ncbi:MAG: oligoendopeptidase F [Ignavibacteriales bacterium]|nr:MAG: oligoendopeptidase F [Ignavibacteriaceae bacterium]MBW7874038.1 oligoendopeptidase F [Ignavibacteria bacterium]MCZ2143138.1 oligoendopeptidase F [Ignavibacteriales bacterium]OQY74009.1 MAG: oligoendopeptidase F [Ignavibacteriales bacterium UTCHB3]MBV6444018.1 Oligoendopeptidase F, plasmid [Ignavibacteriaceae bacterium]
MKPKEILSNRFSADEVASLPERSEIKESDKWDVTHIFANDAAWEEEFSAVQKKPEKYSEFRGKISGSAASLAECIKFDEEVSISLGKLYLYVMLQKDSDLRVNLYRGMHDRISNLITIVGSKSSFILPEINSTPDEIIEEAIQKHGLAEYRHFFDDLRRKKAYTLSEKEEMLMALSAGVLNGAYEVFSIFSDADLQFPSVKDENGNEIEISNGRFYASLYSKDAAYRERAYKAFYKPFIDYSNTFSVIFNNNLKGKIFNARARNFESSLQAALHANNIPVAVYDNLIDTVNANLAPMHRWAEIKRERLGKDKIHPYDAYVTIFDTADVKKYSWSEAVGLVLDSLEVMGTGYVDMLKKAFNNRWVDVYETAGKRSGAYSSGCTYGTHPYVLMNFSGMLNDVFTLAHEMGHNMHSWFTGENQPFVYADYSIFLAEVASTFNESLLLEHLIKISTTKEEKLSLMEKYLNSVTATFYRQTMFAEFEKTVYSRVEAGDALTVEELRELYKSVYSKYWGAAMEVDTEEEYTWARVPHFYYNFYVYQYATGMAASEALVSLVRKEGEPAVNRYLNFLKAGKSDYAINILRNAGVDMAKPDAIKAVITKMSTILDEMERMA